MEVGTFYYILALIRCVAIFLIFLHHYCKTVGLINTYTSTPILAIALFVFISGFLSRKRITNPITWLIKRFLRILLPYWILFNFLIIINLILKFRPYDYSNYIFELLGLQIFTKPLYEATWFISYILILYILIFVTSLFRFSYFLLLSLSFFVVIFIPKFTPLSFITSSRLTIWQFSFVAGYLLSNFDVIDRLERLYVSLLPSYFHKFFSSSNSIIYYFYLLHGPLLFFFYNVIRIGPEFSFILSLFLAIVFSILFQKIDIYIRSSIEAKIFKHKK